MLSSPNRTRPRTSSSSPLSQPLAPRLIPPGAGVERLRGSLRTLLVALLGATLCLVNLSYANAAGHSPSIASVSPGGGPASGGTQVLIKGKGFAAGATAYFGGVPATVTSVRATALYAVTPAHAAGTVAVRVVNPNGSSASLTDGFTYTSPPAPLAADAGASRSGSEGSPVAFSGSASGGTPPYSYSWRFGDGSSAGGSLTPGHVYQDDGTYAVTLTVTDSRGQVGSSSTTATVSNVPPAANAGGPYSGGAGTAIVFSGTATDPGPVDTATGLDYSWSFGDGSTGSGRAPSHAYAAAGIYNARLTVTDKDGGSGSASAMVTVTVSAPPTPTPTPRPSPTPTGDGLARIGLTPGWASFGQAFPRGLVHEALSIGGLPTQTDVKTTWEDGSIRFAILTAKVPAPDTYQLREVPALSDPFTPSLPDAEVRLLIGTTLYTAPLPATPSADRWLEGPLVVEGRHLVTPLAPDGTPHPFLRVVFDTRSYLDGGTRLDVTVENVLNQRGAGAVDYAVDVVANGAVIYHHDTLTHWYLTRWRKVFALPGLTESSITPDFEPSQQAKPIPLYMGSVVQDDLGETATGPKFDILQPGSLAPAMGMVGGRPEIALYPDWVARYVVFGRQPQRQYVLAH